MSPSEDRTQSDRPEHARELRQYLWGYGLAIALTLVPFGLVNCSLLSPHGLYLAIGAFALLLVIVHFRLLPAYQSGEAEDGDLQLILFSGLLLFIHGRRNDLDPREPGPPDLRPRDPSTTRWHSPLREVLRGVMVAAHRG